MENMKKHLAAGIVGVIVLVVLLALMGVNFMAWTGVWFTPKMPYIVGVPLTLLIGVLSAWIYAASVAKAEWGPPAVRGFIFGVFAAALFIWVMPWFFSSVIGEARAFAAPPLRSSPSAAPLMCLGLSSTRRSKNSPMSLGPTTMTGRAASSRSQSPLPPWV